MKKKITLIAIVLSYFFGGLNVFVYELTNRIYYGAYIVGGIFLLMIPISLIDDRNNTVSSSIALILLVFIPTSLMLLLSDTGFWIMILGEILVYIISICAFVYTYRKPSKRYKKKAE